MKRTLVGAVLILLAAGSPSVVSAITLGPELLVNGSFEQPDVARGTFDLFPTIPGWTLFTGPSIEIQDHVAGSPFDGDQFLELDSTGNSGVFQFVDTVPGHLYRLQFAYSPRPGRPTGDNTVNAGYGSGPDDVLIVLDGNGGADTSWTVYSFDLTAGPSDLAVFFEGKGISNSYGGYIDAVSFREVVPEPSSMLLLGAGLLGVRAFRRKKRG